MSEPKFKYGDKVRITTGFYRGVIGRVIDCNKSGGWFKKKNGNTRLRQSLLISLSVVICFVENRD
jgi:transcription antitermination factor NusG